MRVGRGDAERLNVSRLPPHPSGLRPATFPPVGGRLWAIQIRRNSAFCRTFGYIYWEFWRSAPVGGTGGPVCRLYGGDVASPGGASGRSRPTKGAAGASPRPTVFQKQSLSWVEEPWCSLRRHAPGSQRAGEGTRPYGVFTNGSTYRKRDRSGTCPLKRRGEAELLTKFLCLLSFSKKGGDPAPPRRVRFLI